MGGGKDGWREMGGGWMGGGWVKGKKDGRGWVMKEGHSELNQGLGGGTGIIQLLAEKIGNSLYCVMRYR